jgi:hypothetical protein
VRNGHRIGIVGKGPCPGHRKEVEKSRTETLVLVPVRVGWKVFPVRGPVADPSALLRGSGSGEMGDPSIDPPDCIDDIGAICGDLVTNKKILRNRLLHPFFKPTLFFNRPPVVTDLPHLIKGFIHRLAEAWSGNEKNQEENKKGHVSIFKRIREDCQPFESSALSFNPFNPIALT